MKRKYIGDLHQSPFYLSDNVTLQATELAELKLMRSNVIWDCIALV